VRYPGVDEIVTEKEALEALNLASMVRKTIRTAFLDEGMNIEEETSHRNSIRRRAFQAPMFQDGDRKRKNYRNGYAHRMAGIEQSHLSSRMRRIMHGAYLLNQSMIFLQLPLLHQERKV
jgi:hypothetical protein